MGRKQVPCREVDSSTAPLACPKPAQSMLTTATQLWTGRARHCRRMHSAPISCIAGSASANRAIRGPAKTARASPMAAAPKPMARKKAEDRVRLASSSRRAPSSRAM